MTLNKMMIIGNLGADPGCDTPRRQGGHQPAGGGE